MKSLLLVISVMSSLALMTSSARAVPIQWGVNGHYYEALSYAGT